MNNFKYLFLLIVLFSCKKKEAYCGEAYEEASPRLVAYFKPEGTKIKYKNQNGDTATLTFGPIVITQGVKIADKPCKKTYYPQYNQEFYIKGSVGIFPSRQYFLNNSILEYEFIQPHTSILIDANDEPLRPLTTVNVNGKSYRNILIWNRFISPYNLLQIDSIFYNSDKFIIKIRKSADTTWTIAE